MNEARLRAWRQRLGISPVLGKRLRGFVKIIAREEREACERAVVASCQQDPALSCWTERLREAIRERKP